jgi:hypothetical protein
MTVIFTIFFTLTMGSSTFHLSSWAYGYTSLKPINLSQNIGNSDHPIVTSHAGNVYVVWHDSTPGNADIFFKKSSDNGNSFGETINLGNNTGNSVFPQIIANGNNVYVVWHDSTPGNADIFFKKSSDNGNSFGETINLSNNNNESLKPQILTNNDGHIFVTWTNNPHLSSNEPVLNADIFFKKSSDNGNSFGETINLSNNTGNSVFPQIIANGNNVYIVWTDYTGGDRWADIFFKKSSNNGNSFGETINLSKTPFKDFNRTGHSSSPVLAQSNSTLFVIWQDDYDGNDEIYFTKSNDNGTSFFDNLSNRFPINLSNNIDASELPETFVSKNNTFITWQDKSDGNYEIYFTNSSDNGNNLGFGFEGNPINLSNNTGDSLFPKVLANNNNIVLIWTDTTPGNADILFKKSSDNGNSFGETINLSNSTGNSLYPRTIIDGEVYVVWKDLSEGAGEIYFTKITN